MMGCFGKSKLISRLLDGDLSSEKTEQLQIHFTFCHKCAHIYSSYLKNRNLVNESFSVYSRSKDSTRGTAPLKLRFHSAYITRKIMISAAALVIVLIAISSQIITNKLTTNKIFPFLIQNSLTIMNVPLGSLSYYEQIDGSTIQSQFVKVSSVPSDAIDRDSVVQLVYSTYKSPLFYDNDIDVSDYFQNGSE